MRLVVAVALLLALAAPAGAAPSDAQRLADRFAPIVELKEQATPPCDTSGEQYVPSPVELVTGRSRIVLTGPPGPGGDRPEIPAPTAADLYEGDWEMVQLVVAADTPAQALGQEPISVGYSQHDGGERSDWDDGALEREGSHPVVYPASGSHADYFSSDLWLGRSASEGFGCDDTRGPSRRVTPEARVVREPSGPGDPYAWLAFGGNWGQRARGVFNAPSGPNTNKKWARPIDWDEGLRDSSIAVPPTRPSASASPASSARPSPSGRASMATCWNRRWRRASSSWRSA